jgi:hypothetical protein
MREAQESSPSRLRERCLAAQYGPATAGLFDRYALAPPEQVLGIGDLSLVRADLVVACDFRCLPTALAATAVVGAPCIDHCGGDPRRLTLQVFADIVYVLSAAHELGLPALVTLGTREEELVAARSRARRADVWPEIGRMVAEWVRISARAFGAADVRIWQTHEPDCDAALSALAAATRDVLPDRRLNGLYSLDGSSTFPAGSAVFAGYYSYFRRNVVSYLPEFASRGLARPIQQVLVAENLQQHKAVARARELRGDQAGDRVRDAQAPVLHLAPLPSPSLSGRSRMSRAPTEDQLFVADPSALVAGKLAAAADVSRWYWQALLGEVGRTAGADLASALAACRSLL